MALPKGEAGAGNLGNGSELCSVVTRDGGGWLSDAGQLPAPSAARQGHGVNRAANGWSDGLGRMSSCRAVTS